MTLCEMTEQYRALLEMAEDGDMDPEVIAFHLEELDGEIEEKADNIACLLSELNGDIDTIKREEARLAERRKSIAANIDRIKTYLENAMRGTGKTKFKTATHSFGIQKNPPSVSLIDGMPIPFEFLIPQEPKVDRKAILAELKTGKEFDFAVLSQTESLRIR